MARNKLVLIKTLVIGYPGLPLRWFGKEFYENSARLKGGGRKVESVAATLPARPGALTRDQPA